VEITPFRHEGLGNTAYLVDVGDGGAVLLDPGRSAGVYLAAAQERGLRILAVLETHLHADFVSGTIEIAAATGATSYVPAAAEARFPHRAVAPGQRMSFGEVEIEALASPGHAPEHLSYVARSDDGSPPVLFSGGSLIVGGAARTDLVDPGLTEELTRHQYRTLRTAFRGLPDETILMPTHGAGSFCSVVKGVGLISTLGEERRSNPLLRIEDEEDFVRWFPTTFPAAPAYFSRMRPINQRGPGLRRDIPMPPALDPEGFDEVRKRALVVDARRTDEFARGHIPGSLSNPFRPVFGVWLGWLVPADTPLAFVVEEESLGPVIEESMQVGYEDFAGWLAGGMRAWIDAGRPVSGTELVDPEQASKAIDSGAVVVDVRESGEFAEGHVRGAIHVPLGQISARAGELPRGVPLVAYCGHGERASSAVSLLEHASLGPLFNLTGGFAAWKDTGYPVERG
jgi:glyoxylase-like metal-dependent hydrolase (beta-lactamase superfamily II)/rhodanese-related sulfurtransferase